MDGITVPLALQDYMTVLFSAFGLSILTRMVYQLEQSLGRMALIGTLLTVLGGTFKATGKLVLALDGPDLVWLNQGLFPLVAPGFVIVGWALYHVRRVFRNQPPLKRPWLVPLVVIGLFAAGSIALGMAGGPWKVPLILLATVGNVGLLVMLALAAFGRKMPFSGALFLITLLVVLIMSQLAGKEMPISVVWFEQISQTVAQMLFTLGAWNYSQKIEATYMRSIAAQPA